MKITETIAAISSSAGNSGIGIIRISGDEAIEVADRVFKSHKNIRLKDVDSHTVHYGHIVDGDKIIDQVLVIVLKNPHSYTGEDTVEIDCHGGMLILKKVYYRSVLKLRNLENSQRSLFYMESWICLRQKQLWF